MSKINISQVTTSKEQQWLREFITNSWGSAIIVSRGQVHHVDQLPTLIARDDSTNPIGLLTYRVSGQACEVVVLESLLENQGVGTALLEQVQRIASSAGCRRIWLITTNDNLHALQFYQKRGYQLVAVYRHAVNEARKIKPEIPQIGDHGIPIRDEIELELILHKGV